MGLRTKIASTITAIFLALLAAIYGIFSHIILGEFAAIERERTTKNLARLMEALSNIQEELLGRAVEWGHWDETFDFIKGKNRGFIATSLGGPPPFDFKEVLILNTKKQLLFSGEASDKRTGLAPLSSSSREEILSSRSIQQFIDHPSHDRISGFITIGSTPRIIAISTITDTKEIAPPDGFIIFTREISANLTEKLQKQVRLDPLFTLLPHNFILDPSGESPHKLSVIDRDTELEASTLLNNLDGTPIIRVSLVTPREIFAQGKAARSTIMGIVSIFLIVGNFVAIIFLNRSVLNPVRSFSKMLSQISATNNLNLRISIERSDEIGALAKTFNALLQNAEHAYQDMRAARQAAETAAAGKTLFIAKVSHELRTPIHGITGMLRILLKQESAGGRRSYIQMAQDSAHSLLDTINEILDFSRLERGTLSVEQIPFSLYQTVRSTIEHLIPRFEEKPDVDLCWDIYPFVPDFVIGDPLRLKNILTNLLGNAFKFTKTGHVSLKLSPYPVRGSGKTGIRFEVVDSGIGIHEERLPTIFDPFTTGDDTIARLYAGTGLGLAIVKQVSEQMGGTISVTSVLNEGSRFVVEIPFKTVESPESCTTPPLEEAKSVAILSEPGHSCTSIIEGLARYGWTSTIFYTNESDALNRLNDSIRSFDLVYVGTAQPFLIDEISPILQSASQSDTPVVVAVPAAGMTSLKQMPSSKRCFLTHKPISALDLLLISSGRLNPSTDLSDREEEIPEPTETSLHILVADDAPTNRIILKNLLEDAGHTVELFENGQQLVERIIAAPTETRHTKPIDAIMTDIQMPIMDGLTAAQKIREYEESRDDDTHVPIVAVTAYAFPDECSRMMASGINHIITKPISPKRLTSLLSQISSQVSSALTECESTTTDNDILDQLHSVISHFSKATPPSAVSSPSPTQESPAWLDIDDVFDRAGGSLRRTALIFDGFLSSYDAALRSLRAYPLLSDSPDNVRRHAHSLKGLLLDVGANAAAKTAGEIEVLAKNNPQGLPRELIDRCVQQVTQVAVLARRLVTIIPELEVVAALPPIPRELKMTANN